LYIQKNSIEKAQREGLEKGLEEGLEKGREEGREEGEKRAKIEIAKKMLAKNSDIDMILEFTGLNTKEIEAIKQSMEIQ